MAFDHDAAAPARSSFDSASANARTRATSETTCVAGSSKEWIRKAIEIRCSVRGRAAHQGWSPRHRTRTCGRRTATRRGDETRPSRRPPPRHRRVGRWARWPMWRSRSTGRVRPSRPCSPTGPSTRPARRWRSRPAGRAARPRSASARRPTLATTPPRNAALDEETGPDGEVRAHLDQAAADRPHQLDHCAGQSCPRGKRSGGETA